MGRTNWVVDAVHSAVEFEIAHMHVSTFKGRFARVEGTLALDEEHPSQSALQAAVEVKCIEVEDKGLYDRLMGDDFFSAEKHPQLLYRSTGVEKQDDTHWRVEGELTIRGITRPVPLTVEALGGGNHPFARVPMKAFRATGELNRADYGMKWNAALDTGAAYLGEKVRISLQIELLRRA